MMAVREESPTVLCVDDNPHVAEALRMKLARGGVYRWAGWLPDASDLVSRVREARPKLVLLDLDMPGPDPFEALAEAMEACPETRVVVFSGHVREDLVDRAIEAGAWGYVSKNEGENVLLETMGSVLEGEFVLSPEVCGVLRG